MFDPYFTAGGLLPKTKQWLLDGYFGAAEWSVIDDLCDNGLATQWNNGEGWLCWQDKCKAVARVLKEQPTHESHTA